MKSLKHFLLFALFSFSLTLSLVCLAADSREDDSEQTNSTSDGISEVWTNWYKYPELFRVINLAVIRDRLNKNNLASVYKALPDTFLGREITCGAREMYARTDNGSCNSLEQPAMGAKGMAFGRNVKLGAVVKNGKERLMDPSPYEISKKLLRRDTFRPVPFLNFWAASWLQFMNHDWFFHGKNSSKRPYRLRTSDKSKDASSMKIPRTKRPGFWLKRKAKRELPRGKIFRNHVTHWWDGSQVYGSDAKRVSAVRSHRGGKLRINRSGLLSLDRKGIEEVGFKDNWWVGLSLLHHLFVKEHNAIAEALAEKYPHYSDQKLYDVARLVNAAIMAKIHTVEWTPAILPNKTLNWAMSTNWYGALNPETVKVVSENMTGEENFILAQGDAPPFLKMLRKQFGSGLGRLMAGAPAKANHSEAVVKTLGDVGGGQHGDYDWHGGGPDGDF